MEQDPIFSRLMKKSRYEIPDRNFENRVMQKISYAASIQKNRKQNLKLSWVFLGLSSVLLPALLILISKSSLITYLAGLGLNLGGAASILMPAAVLIAAIVILIQLDNLYRLTFQVH